MNKSPNDSAPPELEQYKRAVDEQLQKLLKQRATDAERLSPVYEGLIKHVGQLIGRGGKRLRPILTMLAYEGLGGKETTKIVRAAASQELFHAFILMHDDIIDRDTVRWGGPNITGAYLEEYDTKLSPAEARHFADSQAVLAGDICLSLAYEELLGSGFGPEVLLEAARRLHETLFLMVGGEVLDVAVSLPLGLELSEQLLLDIARYKTAAYTFQMPLRVGALLAGADNIQLAALERYGEALGVAFQLQDDLLGIFGAEAALGKPLLSDLQEGKRTLLMHHGFERADAKQRKTLESALGNPQVSAEHLEGVRRVLEATGAKKRVEELAMEQAEQASAQIEDAGLDSAGSAALHYFAGFVTRRSS